MKKAYSEKRMRKKNTNEEIARLDEIILLHKTIGDSDFMLSQYEAKRAELQIRLYKTGLE